MIDPTVPSLAVELVPTDQLHPDPANPRRIAEEDLDALTRSMRQERSLDGAKPALMVTDPPYGVEYDPSWRNEVADGRGVVRSRRLGRVANDDRAEWPEAWLLSPAVVAYVWHGGLHAATVSGSLEKAGFEVRSQLMWVKPKMVFGRGSCHRHHEPCWYAVKQAASAGWAGDRTQTTV